MVSYEVLIIGAGIAGLTAGIYASRKRMSYVILSEDFGGQINIAGPIENYPGIPKTNWIEFGKAMEEQARYNNLKINYEKVISVETSDGLFNVETSKNNYSAKTIIIASGARARELDVPGEEEFKGKGVTYCAVCDGPLFKDKTVAIIGGGDSALEASDFVLNIAKKIYIININPKLTAQEYLQEVVKSNKKITLINNARTTEILGDKTVKAIKYEQNGRMKKLSIDGVFVEIGRNPNTEVVKGLLKLDSHNHIIVDKFCRTSVPGIFASGDCTDVHEYQFSISAGQGCLALLQAARYLRGQK